MCQYVPFLLTLPLFNNQKPATNNYQLITELHHQLGHGKFKFIVDVLRFTGRDREQHGAVTDAGVLFLQHFPGEDINAGVLFIDRGQVLGAQQNVLVMVDGTGQLVPIAFFDLGDGKQRVIKIGFFLQCADGGGDG